MEARNLQSVSTRAFQRNEIEEGALRGTSNDHLLDDKWTRSLVEITEEKRLLGGFVHR